MNGARIEGGGKRKPAYGDVGKAVRAANDWYQDFIWSHGHQGPAHEIPLIKETA